MGHGSLVKVTVPGSESGWLGSKLSKAKKLPEVKPEEPRGEVYIPGYTKNYRI